MSGTAGERPVQTEQSLDRRDLYPRDWGMLLLFAGGCFVLGNLSGLIGGSGNLWYQGLAKPPLTPPGWVFGVVWTLLYLAMGTAAWLVWRRRDRPGAQTALALFVVQLALNLAWSPAFFGLRNVGLGFAVIVPLLLAVAATTVAFRRVSRPAGWLFLPYLAWVAFATVLAYQIWQLNR